MIALSVVGLSAFFWFVGFNAPPEKVKLEYYTFDPTTCPTEAHGKVYLQVADTVLAYTPDQHNFQLLKSAAGQNPPLGCPTNPQKQTGAQIPFRLTPQDHNLATTTPIGSAQWGPSLKSIQDNPWLMKNVDPIEAAEEYCSHGNIYDAGEFKACLAVSEDFSSAKNNGGYFIAKDYKTPYGHPLILHCTSQGFLGSCSVEYKARNDSFVSYIFYLDNIPMSKVIEFDKGVRLTLNKILIEQ